MSLLIGCFGVGWAGGELAGIRPGEVYWADCEACPDGTCDDVHHAEALQQWREDQGDHHWTRLAQEGDATAVIEGPSAE